MTVNLRSRLRIVGQTDTGKVREHNEDSIAFDAGIGLMVLADGMGGYNAGEVASHLAIETIVAQVTAAVARENLNQGDLDSGISRPAIILRDAIQRANKVLFQNAHSQAQYEGMGTTVVAALMYDNKIFVGHAGDSRLYRLRGEKFERITQDHSLLQELVDRGFYSREEATRTTSKSYVTRALGMEIDVEIDVQEISVEKNDYYLLCSDGLSDMIEDDDIQLTINTFSPNLETITRRLVQLANDNGGRDNISVIVARVTDEFPASDSLIGRIRKLTGLK
jgi:protein phosphatase